MEKVEHSRPCVSCGVTITFSVTEGKLLGTVSMDHGKPECAEWKEALESGRLEKLFAVGYTQGLAGSGLTFDQLAHLLKAEA